MGAGDEGADKKFSTKKNTPDHVGTSKKVLFSESFFIFFSKKNVRVSKLKNDYS
jgi:hypothetical protein